MSKILITGTGRSGTSFLVHLLSALGMDTGYTEQECYDICQNACQAGAEHTIEKPYKILKNPEFMVDIEEIVQEYDIDHVIIPVRDFSDVAKSRANNAENHGGFGGFWNDSTNMVEQYDNDIDSFANMIEVLTRYEIPYTTIAFPKMVAKSEYTFNKLKQVFGTKIDLSFFECFNRIANPNKITV